MKNDQINESLHLHDPALKDVQPSSVNDSEREAAPDSAAFTDSDGDFLQRMSKKAREVARAAMKRAAIEMTGKPIEEAIVPPPMGVPHLCGSSVNPTDAAVSQEVSANIDRPPVKGPIPSSRIPQRIVEITKHIWFHPTSGKYLANDSHGIIRPKTERQVERKLVNAGLSKYPDDKSQITDISLAFEHIEDFSAVDFYGAVGGYEQGQIEMCGKQVLVTESVMPLEAIPGDWLPLKRFLTELLGEKQLPYFYGWAKVALKMFRSRIWQQGQALVIAGEPACGKSLLQELLTSLFGDRMCKPYDFMTDKTGFNGDLAGATLWIIDDEVESSANRMRGKLGQNLKAICSTETVRIEAKYQTPVQLRPLRRLSITLNDNAKSLRVLPPQDADFMDKIMLLRAFKDPHRAEPVGGSAAFEQLLKSQLPQFAAFLLQWEIPQELQHARYGIAHYHNRDLLLIMRDCSDEGILLECIETALLNDPMNLSQASTGEPFFWAGRAVELEQILTSGSSSCRTTAQNLLRNSQQCGTLLGRLAAQYPQRFESWLHHGLRRWKIRCEPLGGEDEIKARVDEAKRSQRITGRIPPFATQQLKQSMAALKLLKDPDPSE